MFWRILRGLERVRTTRHSRSNHRLGSRRIEHLGARQLLTATISPSGVLIVPGTTGNDTILIASTSNGANVQVTINNKVDSTFALSAFDQIQVNASDGNDLITVKGINKPVNVDGGAGVNQLTIIGQASSNSFVLNNQAPNAPDVNTVAVNGNTYTFSSTTIQRLSINGQNANDTFTIQDLPSITTVIDGGAGLTSLMGRVPTPNGTLRYRMAAQSKTRCSVLATFNRWSAAPVTIPLYSALANRYLRPSTVAWVELIRSAMPVLQRR